MTETSQDRGRALERELAAETGLDLVPGSGNGVLKLDLAGGELRLSLKHTDAASIRIDEKMLQELADATSGPGGTGADKTGVLVTRIGALDKIVATLDFQDLIRLLKENAGSIPQTKDEQRRAAVDLPTLLRGD